MAAKMFLIAACVLAATANAAHQVHDQDDDYRPETDYKPKKNEYLLETDYKVKSVICLGVDVTNDCIYRADGNYAIDNEPRSGYVACVRHRTICMPCPYGLVFCSKAGYNGLGQCLGRYDECPPRRY